MPIVSANEWDEFIDRHPGAHLLQTTNWGKLKASFGWEAVHLIAGQVGTQVLFRRLALGFTLAYIPKGPVGGLVSPGGRTGVDYGWDDLWPELDEECRRRRAILLKVEPDLYGGEQDEAQVPPGFQLSEHAIQPPRTVLVSLTGSEDELLARMKQKTRYNIRLAQKKGVTVRATADLSLFHHLLEETGQRAEFGVHNLEYYQRAYELFAPQGECAILVAEYDGQALAAVMVFATGGRAWYFYGASANEHRERMPAYLLQWEAMLWGRTRGCRRYDLWGIPDYDQDFLEANFGGRSGGLWGVYRFKRGFGGEVCRSPGPWDRVYSPNLYRGYTWWLGRPGSE
jgi:peptidoglycan pentaglycine glycine transferase (the first glycine)